MITLSAVFLASARGKDLNRRTQSSPYSQSLINQFKNKNKTPATSSKQAVNVSKAKYNNCQSSYLCALSPQYHYPKYMYVGIRKIPKFRPNKDHSYDPVLITYLFSFERG